MEMWQPRYSYRTPTTSNPQMIEPSKPAIIDADIPSQYQQHCQHLYHQQQQRQQNQPRKQLKHKKRKQQHQQRVHEEVTNAVWNVGGVQTNVSYLLPSEPEE